MSCFQAALRRILTIQLCMPATWAQNLDPGNTRPVSQNLNLDFSGMRGCAAANRHRLACFRGLTPRTPNDFTIRLNALKLMFLNAADNTLLIDKVFLTQAGIGPDLNPCSAGWLADHRFFIDFFIRHNCRLPLPIPLTPPLAAPADAHRAPRRGGPLVPFPSLEPGHPHPGLIYGMHIGTKTPRLQRWAA